MLHNDISNKSAPIIAFNIDELLFMDKPYAGMSLVEKLKWKTESSKQRYLNRPINSNFINMVNRLWNKYNYSIYFVSFKGEFLDKIYSLLDTNSVNYTSIVTYNNWEELREACELRFMYYFDSNLDLLSFISYKNALPIAQLSTIFR